MLDIGMKTLTVMGMLFFLYGVLTLITGRTRRDRSSAFNPAMLPHPMS